MTSAFAAVPKVELVGVQMRYPTKGREILAIDNMDLRAPTNSFVSVIGPSGCGKSTLLKIISRVVKVSAGRVAIEGVPVSDVDLTGRVSFMFQQPLLLPWRNALDNVLLPVQVLKKRVDTESRERATRLLETVGLADSLDLLPHQLSGGMRQRVALARALVTRPEILLMDEPFGAVDEITRELLQEELLRIWQESKTTILLVTHQIEEAVLLSDSIVVMSGAPGTVLEVVDVDLPRPRSSGVRRTAEFHQLVDRLRDLLRPSQVEHADKAAAIGPWKAS
jgi:NitT/TauT family transport system ATP-binding protein